MDPASLDAPRPRPSDDPTVDPTSSDSNNDHSTIDGVAMRNRQQHRLRHTGGGGPEFLDHASLEGTRPSPSDPTADPTSSANHNDHSPLQSAAPPNEHISPASREGNVRALEINREKEAAD